MSGAGYFPNTDADRDEMLRAAGARRFEDLLDDIPEEIRMDGSLALDPALSEFEACRLLARLAGLNASSDKYACFMGAGSYDHYVPGIVTEIASRPEFSTAYTPYQAEISQGTLQAIYEFQSLIARLTGMEISNASLYDGATAMAEAVLMALSISGKTKVVASGCINPMRMAVVETYLGGGDAAVVTTGREDGLTRAEEVASLIDDETGCVIVENPNFFGVVEDLEAIGRAAKERGVVFVVSVDPVSLGILAPPSAFGADIVVGEGQGLGNPMNYGGPNLGFMATTRKYMRRLPGRIVGRTVDADGGPCFCLTLQTREQHIRRARATSNICTNQALNALCATVYLSWLGERGLRELGETCLSLASYAARRLEAGGVRRRFAGPFFREFVVDLTVDAEEFVRSALEQGILAGVPLGRFYPDLGDCLLVALTEKRTVEEIDALVSLVERAAGGGADA